MVITLGNIVFGGKGNGGGAPAAYVVPDGMNFGYSTLTEFPSEGLDFSQKTKFVRCWSNCDKLTSFPLINTSMGTNFNYAWFYCSKLTEFPMLDLSKGTNFSYTWANCSMLTSLPQLDLSSGTNFGSAWRGCSSLTSFPQLDLSGGTNFYNAWGDCYSLTELPALNLSKGGSFTYAWQNCSSLTNLGGFGTIRASIDLSPCTKLTVDSLMNIINQAATVTRETMTLGSTNLAKLTDEQKAVATNKGWTLA